MRTKRVAAVVLAAMLFALFGMIPASYYVPEQGWVLGLTIAAGMIVSIVVVVALLVWAAMTVTGEFDE